MAQIDPLPKFESGQAWGDQSAAQLNSLVDAVRQGAAFGGRVVTTPFGSVVFPGRRPRNVSPAAGETAAATGAAMVVSLLNTIPLSFVGMLLNPDDTSTGTQATIKCRSVGLQTQGTWANYIPFIQPTSIVQIIKHGDTWWLADVIQGTCNQ